MNAETILAINDLTIAFPSAPRPAVDRVSLEVRAGETVAIVGESGSGKSLTALAALRLTPDAARLSGRVTLLGRDMLGASATELRSVRGREVGMIFQEPMTSLNPLHVVERQIGETLKLHQGLDGPAARARVLELLTQVGIREPETRLQSWPHQLSGGQRQRVMIAMALANDPKLLIADEPTTALDVTIQAQILDLLRSLREARGMSLLFISHDLGVVRRIADRVVVMKDGRIVESGPVADVFAAPSHAYTKLLLDAEPEGAPPPADRHAAEAASVEDLKVWFPIKRGLLRRTVGHVKAVKQAQFSLREGETLGVVGESGSGKTTLGLALLRLIPSEGAITIGGKRLDGLDTRAIRPLRAEMQIVFQDPFGSLSPRLTIEEIVGEGLGVHRPDMAPADREALIAETLREVGLDPALMTRYPHEFSGGQRQRIAIARALILSPKFLVLDEPTSALDRTVQKQIVALLRDLQARRKLSFLFISHDLKVVRAMAHRILVMRQGEIVEQGEASQIIAAPREAYTKRLMAAAFDLAADAEAEDA